MRTRDIVTVWTDWSVDDADADVTVTVRASPGSTFLALHLPCVGATSTVSGHELVCRLGVRPQGSAGRVFACPVSVEAGSSGRGSEPAVNGDFSFTMDLAALPVSATLATGPDFRAPYGGPTRTNCGASEVPSAGSPYGRPGIVPSATINNSTFESGTWTCSQSGSTVTVAVTGANLAPPSTPTVDSFGAPIASDRSVLVQGYVGVWVADADLSALVDGDDGGTIDDLTVIDCL